VRVYKNVEMKELIKEIKCLIIETLYLEDIIPDEIEDNEPLFVEGLKLDSIDALEIGVALQKKYQIKLNPKENNLKEHFYSVQTIANYIKEMLSA
jgi:acyl carrier protein